MSMTAAFSGRYLGHPIGDLTGGLMAAIVALPLCLAFGVASGLGAAAGLYGAIACGIVAAIFGGTRAQCSGPTGPMTVVAASLAASFPQHVELVFASVLVAGLIQILMGITKVGTLVHYMPYPVISGFMTGIGAIIIFIEIAPLVGLPGSGNVLEALQEIPSLFNRVNRAALAVSAFSLALIYLIPRISKKIPATLVALVSATALCHWLSLDIPKIGQIPSGLPLPMLPQIHVTDLHPVIQGGLTLAFLGAIDSLLTSLVLDRVTGDKHNSNQELIGQGLGNIASGLIHGLPGAGATMRSMVNVKSGGRTHLSGAVHGVLLLAVLLGLGPVASAIPLPCLAAILLSVGISIMDWRVLRNLRRTPKSDVIVMLVVLFLTMFVDLIIAVLAGIALASVLFVKQLSDAQTSTFSDCETIEELRQLTSHIPENIRKSIYTYQLNGPLFFGEAKNLTESVDQLTGARYIVLRFSNVPLIDQTGAMALESAIEKWEAKRCKVLFVGLQPHIRKILEDTGAIHRIDMENCFDSFEQALEAIDAFEATPHLDGTITETESPSKE